MHSEALPAVDSHAKSNTATPKRLDYLDALRGLAVLGVLVVHTHQNFGSEFGSRVLALGMYGVQLFYIVSAFSLCLSLQQRSARELQPLRNYALRRFFRIAPAFYLAAAVYFIRPYLTPVWTLPRDVNPPPWQPGLWDLLLTVLFVNGWSYRSINLIVPGGWSVAVETNFYILLPILVRFATSIKRALLLLAGAIFASRALTKLYYILIVPHIHEPTGNAVGVFAGMWLPMQLPVFVIGILWFLVHRNREEEKRNSDTKRRAALAAGLVATTAFAALDSTLLEHILPFHLRLCFAMLFGCMLLADRPTKVLVNRVTVFVGKVSYSAYLFHMLVIQLLLWISHAYYEPRFGGRPNFYFVYPVVVVLTCALSYLTYKWIEIPGQSWGRRVIKRWEHAKVPAETPKTGVVQAP